MYRLTCLAVLIFAAFPGFAQSGSEELDSLYPGHRPIGELESQELYEYLVLIGDSEAANDLLFSHFAYQSCSVSSIPTAVPHRVSRLKPFEHTEHQIGFLKPGPGHPKAISPAGWIPPDPSLTQIDITLDEVFISDYPGRGTHQILFTFQVKNQVQQGGETSQEDAVFTLAYQAVDGQRAAIVGYPIFRGLNVGPHGALLQGGTINISNDDDERMFSFLGRQPVNQGLKLLTTAQPALGILTSIGLNIGEFFLTRNRNRVVSKFFVGLDFNQGAATGARLARGSYVVVQAPRQLLNLQNCEQDASGNIVDNSTGGVIPFNYLILRIQ
jgi:hypothetical protein